MTAAVGALAAAAALWLAIGPSSGERLVVLSRRSPAPLRTPRDLRVIFAAVGSGAGAVVTGGALGGVLGGAAGLVVHRGWTARRAERRAAGIRDALPDVLRLVAAELHAGAVPHDALDAAASVAPADLAAHLSRVAAGARLGIPPQETLSDAPPGAEGMAALAACWRVSAVTGAGLADGVARLAAGLGAQARCRAEVEAQLAGPRATAALLGVLPAIAVVMASGLGASPWQFFRTGAGAACLAIGVALDLAGVAWTRRIARTAIS